METLDRFEFIESSPALAYGIIIILSIASVVGTIGNILILLVVAKTKELHQTQSIFIVNLALSDTYVTLFADPMSIVGKIEGRPFFDQHPKLCEAVGKLCTMSCVSSLGSIAFLSLNRYVYICHTNHYKTIFNRISCIVMCIALYCAGLLFVMLNLAGIGDHTFDDKSLECIWDRMATYSYTVVFSVGLVWIPLVVLGMSYIRLFIFVRAKRIQVMGKEGGGDNKSFKLAKTIFIVYAVFASCWIPFAVLLVADAKNTFPKEVHLCITVFGHLHPSLNWFIYYMTNRQFEKGLRRLLGIKDKSVEPGELSSVNQRSGVPQKKGPPPSTVISKINDD